MKQDGEDNVGLGSDFEGARIRKPLGNAAGLPALVEAMRERQYGDALIEKLCYRNWLQVLERTLGLVRLGPTAARCGRS